MILILKKGRRRAFGGPYKVQARREALIHCLSNNGNDKRRSISFHEMLGIVHETKRTLDTHEYSYSPTSSDLVRQA